MKIFKSLLPFIFIVAAFILFIVLFTKIENNNLSADRIDNSANSNSTEIKTSESIQVDSKKVFKNIESDILSSIDFNSYGYGLDIGGKFAYVGRLHSLDIIDMIDKNNPVTVNTIANEKWANKVIAGNGCLYLLSDNSLSIVDNADPDDIDIISEIDFEGFDPKAILDRDLLYIAASRASGAKEESVFYIIDIASKKHPAILSSTKLLKPVYGIYLNDGLIYLSGSGVVYTMELTDTSKPKIISELKFDAWVNDIVVRDNIAYMAGNTGLTIWDFSIKKNPVIINTIDIGGYGKKLFLNENQLFIFNSTDNDTNNFLVADISDSKNHDLSGKISNIHIKGYPQDLKIFKGNLFLLSNEMIDYKTVEGTAIVTEVKSRLYILNPVDKKN